MSESKPERMLVEMNPEKMQEIAESELGMFVVGIILEGKKLAEREGIELELALDTILANHGFRSFDKDQGIFELVLEDGSTHPDLFTDDAALVVIAKFHQNAQQAQSSVKPSEAKATSTKTDVPKGTTFH